MSFVLPDHPLVKNLYEGGNSRNDMDVNYAIK